MKSKLFKGIVFIILFALMINPILVLGVDTKQKKTLYEVVEEKSILDNQASEYVTAETGIDFSQASSDTNGKGVYTLSSTKDDEYPVHYYRGDVKDNNILFANFCWKIVRTTDTGGVKLIYNGVPTDGTCDNTGAASRLGELTTFNSDSRNIEHLGYMYDNNTKDSIIKNVLDKWYEGNLLEYTEQLEDTPWCNDRTYVNGYYGGRTYGASSRATSGIISLSCENNEDNYTINTANGNGLLKYSIALLTFDELRLAGSERFSSVGYHNNGEAYWSMSPQDQNTYGLVSLRTSLGSSGPAVSLGVRPSISLKKKLKY